ncbi:aminopeptidase N [Paraburkholderia fungorum]|uniref:aminopeptidase N n=1 Tax=Paraburkholderia fungorum TaxID=134537 RepID=UPI00248EF91B|nr:aminopeptidase N [Paraburkholderia fungorum]
MADTATPNVIRRADYAPPAFLIDTVALEFDLVPERTVVRNTMRVRRNPDAARASNLELMGEQLEFVSAEMNGAAFANAHAHEHGLTLENVPDNFELTLTSICNPAENTTLSGLYVSGGNFFTQCEAEGFRRITYFLDRPDVMATFTVTLRASKADYPVLLSNGNLLEEGDLPDGRHFARWEDPFRKPSYLFALVAGKLVALEERVTSGSGKEKLLQVWVEPHDLDKTRHAMDSLINSIRWDEQRFGLELDLDRFMIVAVSDFNMGAMENKGLNIFNTKYVLANPETATDTDFANIEAVVGHEYFHNWTGNRVTCRDWFQLSLKEGLTVFRDQEFSADMAGGATDEAARATKRIEDVRVLRQMQFAEDAGPMAHPVRPESYVEINNFYTMTVYEKGSEVVRMYQTLFGRDGFRKGMDLYFKRHDGQAVTCDDFRHALADANGRDLAQFERWYSQAGTPRVSVRTRYDAAQQRYSVTLTQSYGDAAPAARETQKGPLLIPFAIGLIGNDGHDLPLQLEGESKASDATTRVLEFTQTEQTFTFVNVAQEPLPSLLRNFSAPVIVEYDYSAEQLAFLLAHDSDPFNRWEAGQRLATRELLTLAGRAATGVPLQLDDSVVDAFARVLTDEALSPAFRELALMLPSEAYLAEQMAESNPAAVHAARQFVRKRLANALRKDWLALYDKHRTPGAYEATPEASGHRALKNLALSYLAELDDPAEAVRLASAQYDTANNMTDRSAALSALLNASAANGGSVQAQEALDDFYRRFEKEPLVIDKWFALQATQRGSAQRPVIETVRKLMTHPAFNLKNPNRARSLIFSFCAANPAQFHAEDGSGYAFWADQVIALDAINPQVAARLARSLELWRRFTPALRDGMRAALEKVASQAKSRDVREIVEKALA